MIKKMMMLGFGLACWGLSLTASAATADSVTVRIKGMRCEECAHKVMTRVLEVKGVDDIRFNLERRTATVYYDPSVTCPDSITAPLAGTRYQASAYSPLDVILRGIGLHLADLTTGAAGQQASDAVRAVSGVDSLAPHADKHYLFVRYDANKTCKAAIRQALIRAGFTPTNYYSGKVIAFADYTFSGTLPDNVYDLIIALDGVEDVCVNPGKHTIGVTYFNDQTDSGKLTGQIRQAGVAVTARH